MQVLQESMHESMVLRLTYLYPSKRLLLIKYLVLHGVLLETLYSVRIRAQNIFHYIMKSSLSLLTCRPFVIGGLNEVVWPFDIIVLNRQSYQKIIGYKSHTRGANDSSAL